jgi:hypothetical protein
MLARTVTAALLVAAALAWPVAVQAGGCEMVVGSFYEKKEVLEVIYLGTTPPFPSSASVSILWFSNDGAFGGDSALSVHAQGRVRATAKAIFDGAPVSAGNPTFDSHYVKIHMGGGSNHLFSATITRDNVTRELGCVPFS